MDVENPLAGTALVCDTIWNFNVESVGVVVKNPIRAAVASGEVAAAAWVTPATTVRGSASFTATALPSVVDRRRARRVVRRARRTR